MPGFMTLIGCINILRILILHFLESEGERPNLCSIAKSLRVNRKHNVIISLHPRTGSSGRYKQLYYLVKVLVIEQDVQKLFSYRLVCLFWVYSVVQRSSTPG